MPTASVTQDVYDKLRRKLRAGHFAPGTQLVNRKVAAELGTSTIPVREAIGRLVTEGLLQFTPGAGAFVGELGVDELGELYDVREALEVLAAAQAARFATPAVLAELGAICDRFADVAKGIEKGSHAGKPQFLRWLDAEEQFHMRLVAAAKNRRLTKIVGELRVIAEVFAAHRASPRLLTRAVADAAVEQHRAFVEILSRHDVDQARAWMTRHIRHGRDEVLKHIAAAPAPKGGKR